MALVGEESVSGVTGATAQVNQETPPMRIYIIGNDGVTLCREPPATVNKGEVAVASREELHAARLSGKRLWAAALRVDDDIMSAALDCFADQAVIVALAVAGRCVEKIDPEIERAANGGD